VQLARPELHRFGRVAVQACKISAKCVISSLRTFAGDCGGATPTAPSRPPVFFIVFHCSSHCFFIDTHCSCAAGFSLVVAGPYIADGVDFPLQIACYFLEGLGDWLRSQQLARRVG
jgi:hypothetical protein